LAVRLASVERRRKSTTAAASGPRLGSREQESATAGEETGDGVWAIYFNAVLGAMPIMERLVWTSMLFPDYRPAVFDDIPITAIMTMETAGTGTRYVFTALHRDEADLETNKTSGFYEGPRIVVDQFVEHVIAMK
jgi:hypothetical protein